MNALPAIDQKILKSSPFFSSMTDYSICFLIKIQGLCENAFENNYHDTATLCKTSKNQILCTISLLVPIVLKCLYGILKSITRPKKIILLYFSVR